MTAIVRPKDVEGRYYYLHLTDEDTGLENVNIYPKAELGSKSNFISLEDTSVGYGSPEVELGLKVEVE